MRTPSSEGPAVNESRDRGQWHLDSRGPADSGLPTSSTSRAPRGLELDTGAADLARTRWMRTRMPSMVVGVPLGRPSTRLASFVAPLAAARCSARLHVVLLDSLAGDLLGQTPPPCRDGSRAARCGPSGRSTLVLSTHATARPCRARRAMYDRLWGSRFRRARTGHEVLADARRGCPAGLPAPRDQRLLHGAEVLAALTSQLLSHQLQTSPSGSVAIRTSESLECGQLRICGERRSPSDKATRFP